MSNELIPYRDTDPFHQMERVFDRMRGLMEGATGWPSVESLALNVSEDEQNIIVEAAVPGLADEDIDVRVEGDMLTISGERSQRVERGGEDRQWHMIEQRFGRFQRSVRLPIEVKPDKAKADLENGILTITLPKTEPSPVKKIAVKAKNLLEGNGSKK
jgi:HSP20 family protein